jgi:hypothetical protein
MHFVARLLGYTIIAILLRPLINKLFSPTGLLLTECFFGCRAILSKS